VGPLADLVALVHALFSVFVVSGLVLLAAGLIFGWRWTRRPGFRIAHCGAVLFVAARAWLGLPCPLTWLENHLLRAPAAGDRSVLVRQAHAAAFRGEDPERFRSAVTLWALASVGLALFPLRGGSKEARRYAIRGRRHRSPER
jgi:hypothetical protein